MITKKPFFAGKLYPSNFKALEDSVVNSFMEKLGPGETPSNRRTKMVYGAVVPHSSYDKSGQCAAWSYKELGESEPADTYVIIGPNHNGIGPEFSTYLFANWETPFGAVNVDRGFGLKIANLFSKMRNETTAHAEEHSVEVQLPFLQYVNRDRIRDIKFVPIILNCRDYKDCRRLAECIVDASEGKKICLIASSDFIKQNNLSLLNNKSEIKNEITNFLRNMDARGFLNFITENNLDICGASAIAVVIEGCRLLGAKKGRVLQYYTNNDLNKPGNDILGYCAAVFE